MKNPFKRFKVEKPAVDPEPFAPPVSEQIDSPAVPEEIAVDPSPALQSRSADDGFTEWCRSRIRGGIERRERNDIYEAYNVYGIDHSGRLICRRWHRYPEHERDFDLSYSRELSFEDFNRRLLNELDKGDLTLNEYLGAIRQAEIANGSSDQQDENSIGFSGNDEAILRAFCDGMDHLKDQTYLHQNGVLCCECESIAAGERLNIRFRRLLRYDALDMQVAGVSKTDVSGYDIDDIWILGVYNRLHERASSCRVMTLTSEWSLNKESLWLMLVGGFPDLDGEILIAVGGSENFTRFGFYSLDFSSK